MLILCSKTAEISRATDPLPRSEAAAAPRPALARSGSLASSVARPFLPFNSNSSSTSSSHSTSTSSPSSTASSSCSSPSSAPLAAHQCPPSSPSLLVSAVPLTPTLPRPTRLTAATNSSTNKPQLTPIKCSLNAQLRPTTKHHSHPSLDSSHSPPPPQPPLSPLSPCDARASDHKVIASLTRSFDDGSHLPRLIDGSRLVCLLLSLPLPSVPIIADLVPSPLSPRTQMPPTSPPHGRSNNNFSNPGLRSASTPTSSIPVQQSKLQAMRSSTQRLIRSLNPMSSSKHLSFSDTSSTVTFASECSPSTPTGLSILKKPTTSAVGNLYDESNFDLSQQASAKSAPTIKTGAIVKKRSNLNLKLKRSSFTLSSNKSAPPKEQRRPRTAQSFYPDLLAEETMEVVKKEEIKRHRKHQGSIDLLNGLRTRMKSGRTTSTDLDQEITGRRFSLSSSVGSRTTNTNLNDSTHNRNKERSMSTTAQLLLEGAQDSKPKGLHKATSKSLTNLRWINGGSTTPVQSPIERSESSLARNDVQEGSQEQDEVELNPTRGGVNMRKTIYLPIQVDQLALCRQQNRLSATDIALKRLDEILRGVEPSESIDMSKPESDKDVMAMMIDLNLQRPTALQPVRRNTQELHLHSLSPPPPCIKKHMKGNQRNNKGTDDCQGEEKNTGKAERKKVLIDPITWRDISISASERSYMRSNRLLDD